MYDSQGFCPEPAYRIHNTAQKRYGKAAHYGKCAKNDRSLLVTGAHISENRFFCQVYLKEMPLPSDEVGVTILNIVHAGDRVCGYYAAHSADLSGDFRLIKRVSDILNLPASASLTIRASGNLCINNTRNYAVGIGSGYNAPYGTIRIESTGTVSIHASGEKILCLGGGWSAGEGIQVRSGKLDLVGNGVSDTRCDKGTVFGSFGGSASVCFRDSKVKLYGEGYRVSGFGSLNGSCVTRVESGEIDGSLLAVEVLLLGNKNSRFVVTGGNIHLAQESDHTLVSPAGTPLCFANPSKDHYEATFRDGDEEWTYKADRNENGYLGVWILL